MEYKFYEILIIFAFYSILGHLLSRLYNSVAGEKKVRTGIAAGPYCLSYGVCAVILTLFGELTNERVLLLLIVGAVTGTIVEFAAGLFTSYISKWSKHFYSPFHTILWGILSVLIVTRWNHLLIVITRYINPWINMIILLFIYVNMIDQFIDGFAHLYIRGQLRLEKEKENNNEI